MRVSIIILFVVTFFTNSYGQQYQWFKKNLVEAPQPKSVDLSDSSMQIITSILCAITADINAEIQPGDSALVKKVNRLIYSPGLRFQTSDDVAYVSGKSVADHTHYVNLESLHNHTDNFASSLFDLLLNEAEPKFKSKIPEFHKRYFSHKNYKGVILATFGALAEDNKKVKETFQFEGDWKTPYGVLKFKKPNHIYYTARTGEMNHGVIQCYIEGKKNQETQKFESNLKIKGGKAWLIGACKLDAKQDFGKFNIILSEDKNSFAGHFFEGSSTVGETWEGERLDRK